MQQLQEIKNGSLTIWDSRSPCHLENGSIILWRQFVPAASSGAVVSISEIVETHGAELRAEMLRLIGDVSSNISKSTRTNFRLRGDFEYFWMTHFHSRPYTQSGQLNNLAKLFALIRMVDDNSVNRIDLHSGDKLLIQMVAQISEVRKIEFRVYRLDQSPHSRSWRSMTKSIVPRPMLAGLALCNQLKVSLATKPRGTMFANADSISIFDYWYRFAPGVERGRFASQYWSTLVDRIDQMKVNWWHNIVDQNSLRQLKHAKRLRDQFNNHTHHRHEIVDSLINTRILSRTIRDYIRLVVFSLRSEKFHRAFDDKESGIDLWPLFEREWLNSFRGYEAVMNCLRFNRIEFLLGKCPRQKLGIYLMENQPWEMALIHLWRKYNHESLIGVAHSTVRFWDLRLMSDPRQFASTSTMPRPDAVAVNGNLAQKSLVDSGYPESEIRQVEALMYLHLTGSTRGERSANKTTILVATDYLESATSAQLELLSAVTRANPGKYKILLKPHWSQNLDHFNLDAEIVSGKDDLTSFFERADVLFCSAITSAVLDGVCMGVPVIQCLDPLSFNLSPLRNHDAVTTVKTAKELELALMNISNTRTQVKAEDLFNMNPNLNLWSALLDS